MKKCILFHQHRDGERIKEVIRLEFVQHKKKKNRSS